MSSRKQVSDEEKEKLRKMLHGNYYGYGTYEGRGILAQKPTNLTCPNCKNNRMHKVWLVRKPEKEISKKGVMITYTSITVGIIGCFILAVYVIDKTRGRVLDFFSFLSFLESRAIVCGLIFAVVVPIVILSVWKERRDRLRIMCKECDKAFLE